MSLTTTEESQTRALIAQNAALLSLAASEPTIISKLAATKVSLADLTAATSLNDTDLFLVRQGTTEKSTSKLVLTPDATLTLKGIVELATSAETIAGTDATRAVTPASLQTKVATETDKGIVELATSAETIAGTDTARVVTPAGFMSGFTSSLAASGWQKLPSGLIVQFATAGVTGGIDTTITFPIAFPNAKLNVIVTNHYTNGSGVINSPTVVGVSDVSKTSFIARSGTTGTIYYMAVGF